MTDTPMFIEPTIGVRAWRVVDGRLSSLTKSDIWLPGEPMHAMCGGRKAADTSHTPPQKGCTCGVYAVKKLSILRDQDYHADGVLGFVQLWGRIMVGAKGYRAEHAYPLKLFVPHLAWEQAYEGLREYDVPISLINPFRAELDPEEGAI
jgi:hypothetical protein